MILYVLLFGFVLDRPLSLGILRLEMTDKAARLATLPSPSLVILAGSNGPYSHSCVVLGAMLRMPCENAGIAVGIGLDEIFARDAPLLRPGDVVYMPMELQQYTTTRAQLRDGVDGEILLRHDRGLLLRLGPGRVLGAMFCCDLADGVESLAEMAAADAGIFNPAHILAGEYNAQGDRIDNDGPPDAALLSGPARPVPDARAIAGGYGTVLIRHFIAQARARGIIVIGGLPVDFADAPMPPSTLAALRALYGARWFLVLANDSRYPRADFFNSEDHLDAATQAVQSMLVARGLGLILARGRPPAPRANPHAISAAR